MLEFRPLASSSAGCCYQVLAPGADPLLIDAGLNFKSIQQALGFRVSGLAGCLLSHAHGDHCKGIAGLIKSGIDVYASEETWAALPECRDSHRARRVEARQQFSAGAWDVMAFECVHDQPGTLGFIVQAPRGGRLLYLTDSAYSKYRFDGLTHIAVEANYSSEVIRANTASGVIGRDRFARTVRTHMSIERLIPMLMANDLSQVEEIWLLHLSAENSDEEMFRRRVEQETGKPTYIARE